MKDGIRSLRWLTLGSLMAALASSQCGTTSSTSGTESHWLQSCQEDSSCGGLDCVCGVCTRACDRAADCEDLSDGALCASSADAHLEEGCTGGEVVTLCVADDTLTNSSSGGSGGSSGTSTGSGTSGGAGGARGACEAETARGEGSGSCETLVGVRWTGEHCQPLWGCECAGADCDEIAPTYEECAIAHAECFDDTSCWDERHAVVDLLNEHKECETDGDCTSHFVGCGVTEDGCTGATYSNGELAPSEVNALTGRLNTCVTAFEEDHEQCGLCERVSAPAQCIEGRCGGGEACALEVSMMAMFVASNEACEIDADCVVDTAGCGFSEDGCTGAVYLSGGFDEEEFGRLRDDLYACAGEDGSCALCERESAPVACVAGACRPRP